MSSVFLPSPPGRTVVSADAYVARTDLVLVDSPAQNASAGVYAASVCPPVGFCVVTYTKQHLGVVSESSNLQMGGSVLQPPSHSAAGSESTCFTTCYVLMRVTAPTATNATASTKAGAFHAPPAAAGPRQGGLQFSYFEW